MWNCNNNDVATDGNIYAVIDEIRYALKDGVATVVRQPSNVVSATIPSSVTYKETLYSVTSIGDYAFYYCSNLTTINFIGTEEQWNAIAKGTDWDFDTGSYTINYNYVAE